MSPSMSMPKPSADAAAAFRALVPEAEGVTTKPMFGNLAAFVNGNMFAGLFGEDLFVRAGDEERASILAKGGRDFEPMPGRRMTGYVVLPSGWLSDAAGAGARLTAALAATGALPAKSPKVAAAKSRATKAPPRAR